MNSRIILAIGLIIAVAGTAVAQTQPTTQKSLAATLETYVFPTEGQTPEQQSTDEAACYNWAVENTGTDPFQLQKQAQQTAAAVPAGAAGDRRRRPGRGSEGRGGRSRHGRVDRRDRQR